MRNRFLARNTARVLALAFCLGVVLGGSLPDMGEVLVIVVGYKNQNILDFGFLVAGILGVVVCGVALRRRLLCNITEDVVVEIGEKDGYGEVRLSAQ